VISHSLVFETKGILEQPFSTSLLQSGFRVVSVTLSNACHLKYIIDDRPPPTQRRWSKKNRPKVVIVFLGGPGRNRPGPRMS